MIFAQYNDKIKRLKSFHNGMASDTLMLKNLFLERLRIKIVKEPKALQIVDNEAFVFGQD
jgi:hypothetical protein